MNQEKETRCTNCNTTTTPLWRRGINGTYLCNACGLYYKIHQSNRPIELKTDTFKHRQRVRRSINHIYHSYKYENDSAQEISETDKNERNEKFNIENMMKQNDNFKFYDCYEKFRNSKKTKEENNNFTQNNMIQLETRNDDLENEVKDRFTGKHSDKEIKKYTITEKKIVDKIIENYDGLNDLEKTAVLALISLNKEQ